MACGSSPRVRGTVWARNTVFTLGRFIPARAGNGTDIRINAHVATVHPRACGERIGVSAAVRHGVGSSPRVRGTGLKLMRSLPDSRFIPARAGNGVPSDSGRRAVRVHPRACGERGMTAQREASAAGSSPRVRGTDFRMRFGFYRLRFIPARAGNGPPRPARIRWTPVHPRACGERAYRVARP